MLDTTIYIRDKK